MNMSSVSIDNETAPLSSGSESGSPGQAEKNKQQIQQKQPVSASASAASLSFDPNKSNEADEYYSDEGFEDSQQSETNNNNNNNNNKASAELKLFGSVGNNLPVQIHRR